MSEDNQEASNDSVVDWKASLPEEIREVPSIQNFKTPADLAKSYLHQQKFVGKEKLPVPKDDADKETWDMVWSRLGRPEKPDGYKLPDKLENIRPEAIPQKEQLDQFKTFAHSIGLTNKQVEELYKWNADLGTNMLNQRDEAFKDATLKAETNLRKEWGEAYGEKIALAKQAFQAFVPPHKVEFFDKTGLGNDPDMIRIFEGIGSKMSEAHLKGDAKKLTLTPYEARQEELEMISNPKSPLNIADHPEHDAAVERRLELRKIAGAS